MRSIVMAGVELTVDAGRLVGADELFDISPGQFRRLLLTFEETIQLAVNFDQTWLCWIWKCPRRWWQSRP